MLKIQEYIRAGGTLASLTEKYAIVARRHPNFQNLVLLKYNQIESPMDDALVQECRGIILDEAEDWRVVSRPFDKFFNFGEVHAKAIDWSSAAVQEKLDGSLCTIYWYAGEWRVATSGSPDAGGTVGDMNITFQELFWKTFKTMGLSLPPHSDVDINYMFELMTPYNRIVVRHTDCKVKLIGVRDRYSGQELPLSAARVAARGYPAVRSFPLTTMEEITATFAAIDPISQEGYVVVDGAFNRVKVKHPGYVAIHHLKDGFGVRRILEIVRMGEKTELLSYFPEWTTMFTAVSGELQKFKDELAAAYLQIEDFPSQKDFALEAVKTKCSGALFALRAKKVKSIDEYVANMNIRTLMDILGLKDIEFTDA